jgi:hypothetical protein
MQVSAQRARLFSVSSRLPRASRGAKVCAFCRPQPRDRDNPQASYSRCQGASSVIPPAPSFEGTGVDGFFFRAVLRRAGLPLCHFAHSPHNPSFRAESAQRGFCAPCASPGRGISLASHATSRLWSDSGLRLQLRHIALAPAARHKLAQPVRAGYFASRIESAVGAAHLPNKSSYFRVRAAGETVARDLLFSSRRLRRISEFSLYTNDRSL